MMRRGFTVIELVIVIVIMGILLTLAVVNLNNSQANARDAERMSDAESIAVMLEAFYRNASTESTSTPGTYVGKVYPPTSVLSSESTFKAAFPDADPKILRTPDVPISQPMRLVPATNNYNAMNLTPMPGEGATDFYVYQPLRADGTLCTTFIESNPCRKFNLYYRQETNGNWWPMVIESKNQ